MSKTDRVPAVVGLTDNKQGVTYFCECQGDNKPSDMIKRGGAAASEKVVREGSLR